MSESVILRSSSARNSPKLPHRLYPINYSLTLQVFFHSPIVLFHSDARVRKEEGKVSVTEKVNTQQANRALRLHHQDVPEDSVEVNPDIFLVIDSPDVAGAEPAGGGNSVSGEPPQESPPLQRLKNQVM
jgi:hypothetical protein